MPRPSKTPLNREYDRRGLYRTGMAAKVLGIDRELFVKYIRAGQIRGQQFEWNGVMRDGYSYDYINTLKQKMYKQPFYKINKYQDQ